MKVDLIGKRFGRWIVLEETSNRKSKRSHTIGPYWLCQCDCGETKEVYESHLRSGRSKSCGCLSKELVSKRFLKNLVGERFGRLIIIKRVANRGINTYWLCQCDCGDIKEIAATSLIEGKTKSCGCLNSDLVRIEYSLSAKKRVYRTYKKNAKDRNLLFDLTFDKFIELTQQPCYYCNSKPSNICAPERSNGSFRYNGIDRKDSMKGYFVENCVSCCKICNKAKIDLPYDEFIEWIQKIVAHSGVLLKEKKDAFKL